MSDDGLELIEVTGRWVGFYRHRWEQLGTFPIVAELQQDGSTIMGEMYDQITEQSGYLDDYVELLGKDISDATRRRAQQMISRFGKETVRSSRLPETSDIRGTITGSDVQFTKTYRGAMEVYWTVDEQPVAALRRDRHKVEYSGQLDRDRACITGRWTIRHWGLLAWILPPQHWGTFELYQNS